MAYRNRNSETVSTLVDDITTSFEQASQLYGLWKSRRERSNHYRRPGFATSTLKTKTLQTNCALTTSLNLGARTKETYSVGAAILGSTFTRGDSAVRRALTAQRDLIHDQVALLQRADDGGPLDINVILQASETVRVAAIQALVDQYRRLAANLECRNVPRDLPASKWRSPSRQEVVRRGSRDERRGSRDEPVNHNHNTSTLFPSLTHALVPPAAVPHRSRSPVPARVPIPAPVPVAPPPPVAPSARWLTYLEDDNLTTAWSVLSGPLVFQSEPPSPPLTPKELVLLPAQPPVPPLPDVFKPAAAKVLSLDAIVHPQHTTLHTRPPPRRPMATDLESAYNCGFGFDGHGPTGGSAKTGNSGNSNGSTTLVRPKNSVFHIFCPEAMALQVDVRRPVPSAARKCRCGFRWEGGGDLKQMNGRDGAHQLKEGFGMSRRFLAKSHCEGADGGYGCVLCTSSGVAQTYETAEDLRTHINAAHDKWQMLHDRDLA